MNIKGVPVFLVSLGEIPFNSFTWDATILLLFIVVKLSVPISSSDLLLVAGAFALSAADVDICFRFLYSLMESFRLGGAGCGTLVGGFKRGSLLCVRVNTFGGGVCFANGPVGGTGSANVEYDLVRYGNAGTSSSFLFTSRYCGGYVGGRIAG